LGDGRRIIGVEAGFIEARFFEAGFFALVDFFALALADFLEAALAAIDFGFLPLVVFFGLAMILISCYFDLHFPRKCFFLSASHQKFMTDTRRLRRHYLLLR